MMMDTWWKLTKANKWTETPIELRMLLRRWMEQVSQRTRTAQPSGNTVQMCSFFVIVIKDLRKTVSGRKASCWLRVWEVPFHGDGKGVIEPSSSPHGSSETAIGCYIPRLPYLLYSPGAPGCRVHIQDRSLSFPLSFLESALQAYMISESFQFNKIHDGKARGGLSVWCFWWTWRPEFSFQSPWKSWDDGVHL